MKSLLILCALAANASADRRVYDFHATRPLKYRDFPSCLATDRMMKDRHVLTIDGDHVSVDGFEWKVLYGEPDLYLMFHDEDARGVPQQTFLILDLYVNQRGLSGKYTLWGTIPNADDPRQHTQCVDTVYLDGNRR